MRKDQPTSQPNNPDNPEQQLSIMLSTDMNMGDHGETRRIAIEYLPGETVEALVERIGGTHGGFKGKLSKWDVVEIRLIERDIRFTKRDT